MTPATRGRVRSALSAPFLVYLTFDAVARVISLIAFAVAIFRLPRVSVGEVSIGLTTAIGAAAIAQWGTDRGAFILVARSSLRDTFRVLLAVRLIASAVSSVLLLVALRVAHMQHLLLVCLAIVVAGLPDCDWWLRWRGKFVRAGVLRLSPPLCLLAGILGRLESPGCIACYAFGVAVASAGSLATAFRGANVAGREPLQSNVLQLRQVVWNGVTTVTAPVIYFADQLILSGVVGPARAAPYALAYRFLTPLIATFAVAQAVHVPRLMTGAAALKEYRTLCLRLLAVQYGVLCLVLPILGLALPSDYRQAAWLAALLAPQLAAIALGEPLTRYAAQHGLARGAAALDAAIAGVALLLYAVLIPRFHAVGAAVATDIAFIAFAVGAGLLTRTRLAGQIRVQQE